MIRSLLRVAALVVAFSWAPPARAFEREWHVGAGAGLTDLTAEGIGLGPEIGAHVSYGLSDTFDLRLDGRYAHLPLELAGAAAHPPLSEGRSFAFVDAALAYKVDILRAVPWLALGAGYFAAFEDPLPEQALRSHDLHLFGAVGLDYALTRQLGLGATARYGYLLAGSGALGAQLYAEYRFGF